MEEKLFEFVRCGPICKHISISEDELLDWIQLVKRTADEVLAQNCDSFFERMAEVAFESGCLEAACSSYIRMQYTRRQDHYSGSGVKRHHQINIETDWQWPQLEDVMDENWVDVFAKMGGRQPFGEMASFWWQEPIALDQRS